MRTYNLVESASLLGVDRSTLRRWCRVAGLHAAPGAADRRRRWLSRAELAALARRNGRVLLDAAPGDVVELARVVADLAARVDALEKRLER